VTQQLANRVADWLMRSDANQEAREVYVYGLDKLFSTLINFAFVVGLGLLIGVALPAITFFAGYFSLRTYAGGYHADTPRKCFFISTAMVIPILFLIRFYQVWLDAAVFYTALACCTLILVLFVPVGTKNKMPDALEKVVYRRRSLVTLAVLLAGSTVLFALSLYSYAAAVLLAITLTTAVVVAGKIKLLQSR